MIWEDEGACVIWKDVRGACLIVGGLRDACVIVGGSEGVHVSVHFLFITVEGR